MRVVEITCGVEALLDGQDTLDGVLCTTHGIYEVTGCSPQEFDEARYAIECAEWLSCPEDCQECQK